MAQNAISKIQVLTSREIDIALLEENNIHAAYAMYPEYIGAIITNRMAMQNGYKGFISSMTEGLGNTITVSQGAYDWDLITATGSFATVAKPIALIEPDTNTPGLGGKAARVCFDKNLFTVNDIIISNAITPVQAIVLSEPYWDGAGWIYSIQIASPNAQKYFTPAELDLGAMWGREYTVVGENSEDGGSVRISTPIKLQNHLTTVRSKWSGSRSSTTLKVVLKGVPSPTGNGPALDLWCDMADWQATMSFYNESDKMMVYSEYNKDSQGLVKLRDGKTGRPIFIGAGIRDQISDMNKFQHNGSITYNYLDKILMQLADNAGRVDNSTNFVCMTGRAGMRMLSAAAEAQFKTSPQISFVSDGKYIGGKGNELEYLGNQFRKINFPNGISLTVMQMPLYDDQTNHRTKALHPVTGFPIESYRMTLLNDGVSKEGKPLINKVIRKGAEFIKWQEAGSVSSDGKVASMNESRSSSKDGFTVHMISECGIRIGDPLSCAEIVCVP
jgi:hypothetical protein